MRKLMGGDNNGCIAGNGMNAKINALSGAGIMGGVLLSAIPAADAAIIYSGGTILLTGGVTPGGVSQTLAVGGETFTFRQIYDGTSNYKAWVNLGGNKIFGTGWLIKNFSEGETITGTPVAAGGGSQKTLFAFYYGATGNFGPGNLGYIGFKLSSGNYGWAEVTDIGVNGSSYTISGWAYEDSGATIKAGEGKPSGSAVPEPSGLALLACGAAGVFALRRTTGKRVERSSDK